MKTTILLLAVGSLSAFAQEEIIPTAFSKDRYAGMVGKSPFVLATEPTPVEKEVVDPFANIVLKGVGADYVVIQRLGDDQSIRLQGKEKNEGFVVTKINWSTTAGQTNVEVLKDGVAGTIRFNENDIRAATPSPAPQQPGRKLQPGAAPLIIPGGVNPAAKPNTSFIPKPNATSIPLPQVARPTGAMVQPAPGQPTRTTVPTGNYRPGGTTPQGNDFSGDRRRIRGPQINNR